MVLCFELLDERHQPLTSRIVAEIESLGFGVEIGQIKQSDAELEPLKQVARESNATAAMRVLFTSGTIEVWAFDPQSAQEVYREAAVTQGDEDFHLISLMAAEIFRATLLEARVLPANDNSTPIDKAKQPASSEAPVQTSQELTAKSEPRIIGELAPALTANGFAIPPTFNLLLAVRFPLWKRLSISVFGLTPLISSRIEDRDGTARVHFGLIGGALRFVLGSPHSRWSSSAGLGYAALFYHIKGQSKQEGGQGKTGRAVSSSPILRLGVSVALIKSVRLYLAALGGYALSETKVRMMGRDVAGLGRPLILIGALGVEADLW